MMKPQKRKYRIFARDFDKKPTIVETDSVDEMLEIFLLHDWITITVERNLKTIPGKMARQSVKRQAAGDKQSAAGPETHPMPGVTEKHQGCSASVEDPQDSER